MVEGCWWTWNEGALSKDGILAGSVVDWVALGEVELMLTSSTLAAMMHHVMMIAPWGVIGSVEENGGSAAGSVTGTRTGNADGPDPANGVDVPAPERGRERGQLEQLRKPPLVPGVATERRNAGGQQEETAGVGRGVGKGREGAGAEIASETGSEARGWMGRRSARETLPLRAESACWRNMREKWARARRSVETGTEKGTGTAGAATGTETGAGETGTETGSIKGSEGRETGGTAERSDMAPYETTWAPKMTWATRMREEHHHTWRSTVRMG